MLHRCILHGSGVRALRLPILLFLLVVHTILEYTSRASGPEILTTPIPPFPGGVETAYIVCRSEGEGTSLVENSRVALCRWSVGIEFAVNRNMRNDGIRKKRCIREIIPALRGSTITPYSSNGYDLEWDAYAAIAMFYAQGHLML